MINETFAPAYTQGQTVAPGAATANVELGKNAKSICFTNLGTVTAYVRCGDSAVVATAADYPVLPNSQVSISKAGDQTHVAFIGTAVASPLHIIPGEGF